MMPIKKKGTGRIEREVANIKNEKATVSDPKFYSYPFSFFELEAKRGLELIQKHERLKEESKDP